MRILVGDVPDAAPDDFRTSLHRLFGENLGIRARAEGVQGAGPAMVSLLSKLRDSNKDDRGTLDLHDQPELLGAIYDALGQALLHQGHVDEADRLIRDALRIRRRLYGEDHPATASSLVSYSRLLRTQGKLQDSENAARRALTINSRVFGAESLPVAVALNELAAVQVQQSDFTAAEQSALSGLAALKALRLDDCDPNASRLLDVLGRVQQTRGNYERASEIYRKALTLDRQQVGEKNIKYAMHLANFATVEEARGCLDEAEEHYRRAIEIYLADTHNRKHPDLIDAVANLGALLQSRGKLKEARQRLEEALRLGTEVRGPNHLYVGLDHTNLGRVDHAAGDLASAERNFSGALQILRKNVETGQLPAKHAHIAEALTWKARVLLEGTGAPRANEAEGLLEEAQDILKVEFGERSIERAVNGALLGRALFLQRKELDTAKELLVRNYPIVAAIRGGDSAIAQLIKRWIDELPGDNPRAS